jgi:hypothetical protein
MSCLKYVFIILVSVLVKVEWCFDIVLGAKVVRRVKCVMMLLLVEVVLMG